MNHRPVAIGLVLCEVVIVDEHSRNVTPVNCFGSRKLESVPGTTDFHVVAWLADGLGEMTVELLIRALDSLDAVYRIERSLRFDDPLKDMRFVARIRDCPIHDVGYYEVILSVDGELVANRKILLNL